MLKGSSIFGIDCVNGSLISHRYKVASRLVCSFEKGTNSFMLTSFDPIYLICWQYFISISDDNENYDECFVIMLMTTTGGEGWLGPGPGWGRLWWPTGRAGGRSTSSSLSSSPYHTIILMTIDHCHRFNIGAGNSLDPEIDDLQSGQSESFRSHLVVQLLCTHKKMIWSKLAEDKPYHYIESKTAKNSVVVDSLSFFSHLHKTLPDFLSHIGFPPLFWQSFAWSWELFWGTAPDLAPSKSI